jgi:hypothetical protein
MTSRELSRFVRGVFVAAAMLAGCGGSQPSAITMPAQPAVRQIDQQRKSGSGGLIYAASKPSYVLTYPQGKLVGTIKQGASDACSDSSGNVFLVGGDVEEYLHGATSPSATFSPPGSAYGCAVDPTSGDLAVVYSRTSGSDVAIFPNGTGQPVLYTSGLTAFYCGYDAQGDLFVDGIGQGGSSALNELPQGAGTFQALTIAPQIDGFFARVQYDGNYITVESQPASKHNPHVVMIKRLSVMGSTATVVGSTSLKRIRRTATLSWIQGDRVVIAYGNSGRYNPNIGYWKYPAGGAPVKEVKHPNGKTTNLEAVTISQ